MSVVYLDNINLKEFVKTVYTLSKPVGMGMLHFREGELPDEEAESLIDRDAKRIVVRMDYVLGRQCKMTVFKEPGTDTLYIRNYWPNHSDLEFQTLLEKFNLKSEA